MSFDEGNFVNFKKGDAAAFRVVFDTFYERLYAFAYKYVLDSFASEEIVAVVMVKIWEKRNELSHIANLKPYLYTSVRNASLDYLRKSKKVIPLDASHENVAQFEMDVIEEETHAILIKAVNSLPQKCKKIFELSCIEGQRYKDIAEDLQISVNTVKSQRARAIQLLKDQLKDSPNCIFILNLL